MALFYFISGTLLKPLKYETIEAFIISRIKSLYVPFVVFYLILYFYWLLVERPLRSILVSRIDALIGIFWGSDSSYWMLPAGVLWFIISLFSLEVLVYVVIKYGVNYWIKTITFVALAVIGVFMARNDLYVLPWSLNNALISIPFFMAGYLLRDKLILDSEWLRNKKYVLLFLVPILIFSLISFKWICEIGNNTDIGNLLFPPIYIFYTIPFIEVFLWVAIAMIIDHSLIFEYLGRNTLPILAFHPVIIRGCLFFIDHASGLAKAEIKSNFVASICMSLVVLALCLPLVILWNRLYPRIIRVLFANTIKI